MRTIGQDTKRTIEEVLDVETGDIILSVDFFKKPESEIVAFRRRLQQAIAGYESPKFVCAYCKQLLKLSGKSTKRGEVSFFSHLYDSDDCEIKTTGEYTKEEIEIRKYSNIRESKRHIELKNEIAIALKGKKSLLMGVTNVEIEKRLTSSVPYLFWRQPDISAEFDDKFVVFELQLSTTFLSTIVDRDIFYRMHEIFIVWIFNFSDNQEYVNLNNLMCKDIYYSNKRNAFVFDEKARRLSKEEGELILLCIWFEPLVENGIFNPNKGIRKEEYIKLSDLKFDHETFKPYFVDADSLFYKFQPELKNIYKRTEDLFVDKIRKIEVRIEDKENLQKRKEEKIIEVKEKIKQGKVNLQRFQKKDKYGFEVDGIEIIEAKYIESTDFSNSNYVKLKFNKKYGFIDRNGDFVFDCIFAEAFDILNNKCIVKKYNDWLIVDLINKKQTFLDCFNIVRLYDSDNILKIIKRETYKDFVGVNRGGYNTYRNNYSYDILYVTMEGERIDKSVKYQVYDVQEGKLESKIDEYYAFIDVAGNEMKTNKSIARYINSICTRIIDKEGNFVFPMEFDTIEDFIDGRAKARRDMIYGYIDVQGKTVIPFEYELIEDFASGKAKAKKNGKYGYIDIDGNAIIPFKYQRIGKFIDGKAEVVIDDSDYERHGYINENGKELVQDAIPLPNNFLLGKKFGKWGIEDINGSIIVPFEYDIIEDFIDDRAKARKNGRYGFIGKSGEILIPFEYDYLEDFIDDRAKATKNGKDGFIGKSGEILIPLEYYIIEDFIDDRAKATKNGKDGFIGKSGEILIPFEYDYIEDFFEDRAKAMKILQQWRNIYGYIDKNGNELIENVVAISENVFKGEKFGKWGTEDINRNIIIPFEYDFIGDFVDNRARAKKNGKFGFIDISGEVLISFEYDDLCDFVEDRAKARKNGRYGFIGISGEILIPFEYDYLVDFIDDRAKARKNGKDGFIGKSGEILIPFEYYDIKDFVDDKAKVTKILQQEVRYGYIDKNGNELIENVVAISENVFKGEKFGKWGTEDINRNIIIPFEYDFIGDFVDNRARAKKNGKFGFIDISGEVLISFEYDDLCDFVDDRAKARKNGRYGFIGISDEILIPFEYDYIQDFIDDRAIVMKNMEHGIIDKNGDGVIVFKERKNFLGKYNEVISEAIYGLKGTNGDILIEAIYDKIDNFNNGLAKVYNNKKYIGGGKWNPQFRYKVGCINDKGNLVIPCIFDEIGIFIDGKAKAKKDGIVYFVDSQGSYYIQKKTDVSSYSINSIHKCRISKIVSFGLFVILEDGMNALLHISELTKYQKTLATYSVGEIIDLKILSINKKLNRISMTFLD